MKRPFFLYILVILHIILGLGAFAGGGMLILKPDGSWIGMQRGWLNDTPFDTYFLPGLILFTLNGLFPLFTFIRSNKGGSTDWKIGDFCIADRRDSLLTVDNETGLILFRFDRQNRN